MEDKIPTSSALRRNIKIPGNSNSHSQATANFQYSYELRSPEYKRNPMSSLRSLSGFLHFVPGIPKISYRSTNVRIFSKIPYSLFLYFFKSYKA